jgi:MFS family permease
LISIEGLNRPLLNVYPLDLGATEAQQATLGLVVMMPSTLKIVFGFVSDNFPILGYRRKPYMLLGWLVVSIVMALLYQSSDLSMEYDDLNGHAIPPQAAPSIERISLAFFNFGVGMWMADVMGDSIVVSRNTTLD